MYMVKFTLARSHLLVMNAEMHFYEEVLGKKMMNHENLFLHWWEAIYIKKTFHITASISRLLGYIFRIDNTELDFGP